MERISAAQGWTCLLYTSGIDQLQELIAGKVSAFTGNSGVGKSSILNALEPGIALKTGEVSDKLGRGRHTTRHVELVRLSCGGVVADTPGLDVYKRQILTRGESALTKVCHPVTKFDQKLWDLIDDMKETLAEAGGCLLYTSRCV